MVRQGGTPEPYDARMQQGEHARALTPALLGPVRLEPFRARRLDLGRVAGAPGEADRSVSARLARELGTSLDATPGLHVHEYQVAGRRVRGLVGLLRLDRLTTQARAEAAVLPHEGVDPDRVRRLVARMGGLGLDPAPILLTPLGEPGADAGRLGALLGRVIDREPDVQGTDARHHAHRLWRVDDPDDIVALGAAVAARRYLLADGHHRWAAHLELLGRRAGAAEPSGAGDGRALVMVVDSTDAPVLHALHRVALDVGIRAVLDALASAGIVARPSRTVGAPGPSDAPLQLAQDEVVVDGEGQRVRVALSREGSSTTVVERVHAALDPLVAPSGWVYHHRMAAALEQARSQDGAVALALPPPSPVEVADAARAGRLLPVKATSFQPKPPFGVLYRSWRDG